VHKLITWFQINYPNYRDEMKNSMHNFDDSDLNPYHLESDCWSHTMMVCKIAQLEKFAKTVQVAALLHDIGKPSVRKVNPKNNHVQFFGHEIVSAYLSIDILSKMLDEKMINKDEFVETFLLIALHSTFHTEKNIINLFKMFKEYKSLFIHLVELNKCDNLGRFYENSDTVYTKEKSFKSLSLTMSDAKLPKEIYTFLKQKPSMNSVVNTIENLF